MSTQTPNNNCVLCVDPGFDRLGVAILEKEKGKEKVFFSDCIKTNPKDKREKRLLAIGFRIRQIIKEWQPKSLAIETLFFNQNTTSAIGVAEARGVVLYEAASAGLEVFEYSPQAIKIAVAGYGKASKEQVLLMVKRLLSLPLSSKKLDDEIDAIALGITHLATERRV